MSRYESVNDGMVAHTLKHWDAARRRSLAFLSREARRVRCATAGDRTLQRYRALALRRGPLCPTGIVAPEKDEVEATLGDWLNEIERVQLMLRLTPRLREMFYSPRNCSKTSMLARRASVACGNAGPGIVRRIARSDVAWPRGYFPGNPLCT
jgi:hypothetical protein